MIDPAAASVLEPIEPVAFGSYTLVAKLAIGGMGEVFVARRPAIEGLSQLLVLKRIRIELASDPQFVSRFLAEAKVLLHLQHSAITQVYDVGAVQGRSYIALELVDGKDLRALLTRMQEQGRRLPPGLALQIVLRVLDALAYAHRKKGDDGQELNLVHRDISPQNVLVSYDGEVKVIDFGLAKSALSGQRTQPSVIMGKLLYMAPEIARHDTLDRRADLFATGVMLHEMLAGKHELAELNPGQIMAKVVNPSFPRLEGVVPDLPKGLDAALQKALAVEPAARYRTAEEMRAALLPLAVAGGADLSPETLGEFVREAFASTHAGERQILRQLRATGDKPDTHRSVPLGLVQSVAPTTVFPVISGATPAPATEALRLDSTYVGSAPLGIAGDTYVGIAPVGPEATQVAPRPVPGRTEPAMLPVDLAEFRIGASPVSSERPGRLVDIQAKVPASAQGPARDRNPDPLQRAPGNATLPALPPLPFPSPLGPGAPPLTEPGEAPDGATLEVLLPGLVARNPPVPRQRSAQPSGAPPRTRSDTGVPRPRVTAPKVPAAPPPSRMAPLFLGIGLGAVIAALATTALILWMRHG